MKNIRLVMKLKSNKYGSVLRFVLENSTGAIITIVALLVLSGAAYSVVASNFNDKNDLGKATKLKAIDKTDLHKPTDSTIGKSKGEQTAKRAGDHNASMGTDRHLEAQHSTSSPPKNTGDPNTSDHSAPPTSPPEKPAGCPYRSFDAYLSPLARHNSADTISYTATYTITPTCINFGNPNVTITITTGMHYSPCINMADRNNGIISITRRYDGNGTFSITCIVKRVLLTNPSVPHYVAPLPSASRFYLGISATLGDGSIVGGGSDICYLEAGFDRY